MKSIRRVFFFVVLGIVALDAAILVRTISAEPPAPAPAELGMLYCRQGNQLVECPEYMVPPVPAVRTLR